MEYLMLFGVLFALFVVYIIRCMAEDKKRIKRFERRLRADFGQPSDKKYLDGRLETLANQYQRKEGEFCIDPITWNDLDLDRVFKKMDYTLSSAGEETLYTILRKPVFEERSLKERDEIVNYFFEHEEERVKLWMFFARVGRTGKYSIYDYVRFLNSMETRSNQQHFGVLFLMVLALCSCLYSVGFGVLVFVILFSFNIVTYMKDQEKNAPYVTTFEYFIRVLHMVKELESVKIPVIASYLEELKRRRTGFDSFLRFSWLVTRPDGASSDPAGIILDYVKMGFHVNLIKFNQMLNEAKSRKEDILYMVETLGYIEAMLSICQYRASLEYYVRPEFSEEKKSLIAKELFHPLIEKPVTNSISLDQGMLLTGSNASGKSTFLKTVAISQILAQTIYTVPAKAFASCFYGVYTSMALRDDLASQDSYFIVEIKALKRIVDAVKEKKQNVMCFVDEVLRGTNTVERIAASTEILKNLDEEGAFCFAATHDIELTSLLEKQYLNYHFEETIQDGDVKFNYLLKKDKATSRNAIKLLGVLGYEEDITKKAENRAEAFLALGEWK